MKVRTLILTAAATVTLAAPAAGQLRPDDRAGIRGAGTAQPLTVRPDDRAGIRGIGQPAQANQPDALARYLANHTSATRPDDRPGWRGAGPSLTAPPSATAPAGTSWNDFGLGALIGAAATLAALAAAYSGRNHIHRPHLPLHGH